jgi:hypothetical protein
VGWCGAGPGFFIVGLAFFSSKRAVEGATMTREEIEKRMDELGRQYADAHDELVRATGGAESKTDSIADALKATMEKDFSIGHKARNSAL